MSEQEENVESEKLAEDIRQIKEMGSVTLPDAKHVIHCLNIIGQVEGHYILPAQNKTTKYEHVLPLLTAVEENSSGGRTPSRTTWGSSSIAGMKGRKPTAVPPARRISAGATPMRSLS